MARSSSPSPLTINRQRAERLLFFYSAIWAVTRQTNQMTWIFIRPSAYCMWHKVLFHFWLLYVKGKLCNAGNEVCAKLVWEKCLLTEHTNFLGARIRNVCDSLCFGLCNFVAFMEYLRYRFWPNDADSFLLFLLEPDGSWKIVLWLGWFSFCFIRSSFDFQ